jgi:hypothetical protein
MPAAQGRRALDVVPRDAEPVDLKEPVNLSDAELVHY